MTNCLFCKIANRKLPSEVVYENGKVLAFKDINPKASIHFLIIPKNHIESIKSPRSEKAVPNLILVAKQIAEEKGITGYKLLFNVGREGGQIVDHLHLHFLSGKPKQLP